VVHGVHSRHSHTRFSRYPLDRGRTVAIAAEEVARRFHNSSSPLLGGDAAPGLIVRAPYLFSLHLSP